MALKRKAVAVVSSKTRKALEAKAVAAAEAEAEAEAEAPETSQAEAKAVLKRPAAAAAPPEGAEEEEEKDEEEEEEDEEEGLTPEQKLQEQEEQEAARRTKELKGTPVDELKGLATKLGVELGNKAAMVEAVVSHEAKLRADHRAHEAKLRAVVVKKKEELESLSLPELARLCNAAGLKGGGGVLSKQARVQLLLKKWQEEDGVDQALRQMAQDERRQALESMEKCALQDLCERAGLDPFVTEVMADRISKRENEMGCYLRPAVKGDAAGDDAKDKEGKDVDMVAALLESEKTRKTEQQHKRQQEEAAANKRKELRAMTIDELKKALSTRGIEPAGKKEEMVEALFGLYKQEQAVAARKAELKALGTQELKELATSKGIPAGGKEKTVEALLAHEEKLREELRAFDAKASEISEQKKEELEGKTNSELKDLCEAQGLKVGGGKDERVARLLEHAQQSGEIHSAVTKAVRQVRRQALAALPREELVELCAKLGVDPLVKEVMVERVLVHEAEHGKIEEVDTAAPPAKKARTGKK